MIEYVYSYSESKLLNRKVEYMHLVFEDKATSNSFRNTFIYSIVLNVFVIVLSAKSK